MSSKKEKEILRNRKIEENKKKQELTEEAKFKFRQELLKHKEAYKRTQQVWNFKLPVFFPPRKSEFSRVRKSLKKLTQFHDF